MASLDPDLKWPHTGAVLAGGSSTRMGEAKSDMILPTGETMIEAVITTLDEVCARVVTVGGTSRGRKVVADLRSGKGPLGGIEALLRSDLDDNYLICPNDMPLLTAGLVRRLTVPSDAMATIFDMGGVRIQTLPLRISVTALPTVSAALDRGENAIHRVLARLDKDMIRINEEEARALKNINTLSEFTSI